MTPGEAVDVAPGVRRIVAPNPGMMTGPGTNTYLVGTGDLLAIDPGPDDDSHLEAILAAAAGRLRAILVTHTHSDHSPLSARLKQASGAPVFAHGPAPARRSRGLDSHDWAFNPDRRLASGDVVDVGGVTLTAVHTPGHTSNHLCFDLDGLLFSGDHVMSGSTVVISPPDGDMSEYLDSLRRVRRMAPRRIAPGHGSMIDDPAAVLDEYLAHRADRERQVVAGLAAAGPAGASAPSLVAAIYRDVPEVLHPVARYSLWAHLRQLGAEGRAVGADPDDIDARWWPAGEPGGSACG